MITAVVDKNNIKGNIIEIKDKKDINHLLNSFRIKKDDELRVVDGSYEYTTRVIFAEKKLIECEIINKVEDSYSLNVRIDAGLGLLKNDKMELAIQKLAEIGISKLIPLKLERTIVKVEGKKEKWDIIAKETLKQCQGIKFMEIDQVRKLEQLDYKSYDLILVPYECEEELTISQIIDNKKDIKKILYIIGSEGGISKNEIEYLKQQGASVVSLGKRILRAETASIVVGGILANEF